MSAPVTIWIEQSGINPTLIYDDPNTIYDDPNTFYDGFDPTSFDPRPESWTDVT